VNLSPPFHAVGEHLGIELPGGRALFTTRRGGSSLGPFASLNLGLYPPLPEPGSERDDRVRVTANRRQVATLVGIPASRFAHGRQVHGTTVARVVEPPRGAWEAATRAPVTADGQATALEDVAPIVLVADCLPVALVAQGAVAMVHAGWRGLAGGVIADGIAALRELGARGPVAAAVGPGAGRCCYEVGEEVHRVFAHHGPAVREDHRLDLKLIAARELHDAGVQDVHDSGLCTLCEPSLFFSHRRDRGLTGRQAGVAWRS
jgi:purine-nucleoside/S-methyl-5'-thioadenosine phosphorylase / adenosine deaminase